MSPMVRTRRGGQQFSPEEKSVLLDLVALAARIKELVNDHRPKKPKKPKGG